MAAADAGAESVPLHRRPLHPGHWKTPHRALRSSAPSRDQAKRADVDVGAWSGIGYGLAAGSTRSFRSSRRTGASSSSSRGRRPSTAPLSIAVLPLRVRADREELESVVAKAQAPSGILSPYLVLEHGPRSSSRARRRTSGAHGARASSSPSCSAAATQRSCGPSFTTWPGMITSSGGGAPARRDRAPAPTGAVSGLARYRRRELEAASSGSPVSWAIAPLGVSPGLSLVGRYGCQGRRSPVACQRPPTNRASSARRSRERRARRMLDAPLTPGHLRSRTDAGCTRARAITPLRSRASDAPAMFTAAFDIRYP